MKAGPDLVEMKQPKQISRLHTYWTCMSPLKTRGLALSQNRSFACKQTEPGPFSAKPPQPRSRPSLSPFHRLQIGIWPPIHLGNRWRLSESVYIVGINKRWSLHTTPIWNLYPLSKMLEWFLITWWCVALILYIAGSDSVPGTEVKIKTRCLPLRHPASSPVVLNLPNTATSSSCGGDHQT